MSLIVLLLAQTAALDSSIPEAAAACAVAADDKGIELDLPMFRGLAQHLFYTMRAAEALPGDAPFRAKVRPLLDKYEAAHRPEGAELDALLAECDRRFPLARKLDVAIPAEPAQRDLMCLAVWRVIEGFAATLPAAGGDLEELERLNALGPAIKARVSAGDLARHGGDSEAGIGALLDDQYNATLKYGNVEAVARACEASLKG